jgi:hypothetical protein
MTIQHENQFQVHKDRNVYILGAGFSRDAGLPLINDFMNKMRDASGWLREKGHFAEAEAVETVFKFRLEAASAVERVPIYTENIESIRRISKNFSASHPPLTRQEQYLPPFHWRSPLRSNSHESTAKSLPR